MIKKKGKKTDRTVMMENCIYDYFIDEYGIELTKEPHLDETGRYGIPDFIKIIKTDKRIEDIIIVEIKQSTSDFYSGHGLNFVGTSNYLAVPSELVGFAIVFLRKVNCQSVGVIEVTDKGLVRTVVYPMSMRSPYLVDRFKSPIGLLLTPYHLLRDAN